MSSLEDLLLSVKILPFLTTGKLVLRSLCYHGDLGMTMFRVSHISVSRQQWSSTHHSFFGTVQPRGKQPCFRGLFLGVIAGILLIIGIMLTWIGKL